MKVTSRPVLCNYYVTYRCNATCSFCDIWEKPSPYIKIEDVEKNLIDLKKLGVKIIDFTGGEPLLHREIDQILKLAKNKGFITTLTTNGLLYPKWASRINGLVDMLHFSLDSPNQQKHDASRGVASFENLLKSIKIAKENGERPDILFTVFSHNINEIEDVYQDICLPNNLMLLLNPVFEYNEVETGEKLATKDLEMLRTWGKQPLVYLNDSFIELRLKGGNQVSNPVCKAGSTTIVISPENKLVLPCYHLGIEELKFNGDLFGFWNSMKVQNLIALEGKLPGCQGCTINCYMQPSFAVEINNYWLRALPSTIKYNFEKGTWKQLFKSGTQFY